MVVTHFDVVDVVEKQLYIIPRVMMASDDAALARLFFFTKKVRPTGIELTTNFCDGL